MYKTKLISILNSNNQNILVEVDEAIAKEIKHFDNKENYISKGLKASKYITNDNKVIITKGREVSLDFLHSKGIDFKTSTDIYEEVEKESEIEDLFSKFQGIINDKEKQVLILSIFEGYTEKEISTMLGISQSTVNYRKTNALSKLKKYYENQNI